MSKGKLVLGVLVVAGAVAFFVARDRDERIIRSKLDLLAATASKPKGTEEGAVLMKRMLRLGSLFTKDCLIQFGDPQLSIRGVEQLMGMYSQGVSSMGEFTVSFHDVSVSVADGRRGARAVMTAKASSPELGEGQGGVDAWEIEMTWLRQGKHWKIAAVKETETLH